MSTLSWQLKHVTTRSTTRTLPRIKLIPESRLANLKGPRRFSIRVGTTSATRHISTPSWQLKHLTTPTCTIRGFQGLLFTKWLAFWHTTNTCLYPSLKHHVTFNRAFNRGSSSRKLYDEGLPLLRVIGPTRSNLNARRSHNRKDTRTRPRKPTLTQHTTCMRINICQIRLNKRFTTVRRHHRVGSTPYHRILARLRLSTCTCWRVQTRTIINSISFRQSQHFSGPFGGWSSHPGTGLQYLMSGIFGTSLRKLHVRDEVLIH